jgi:hypothetical protein
MASVCKGFKRPNTPASRLSAASKELLRVRSFGFSHSVIESLTQTRVVMLLNVISFEQRLNFIGQRLL